MTADHLAKVAMLRRLADELETQPNVDIVWHMDDLAEGGPIRHTLMVVVDHATQDRIDPAP